MGIGAGMGAGGWAGRELVLAGSIGLVLGPSNLTDL